MEALTFGIGELAERAQVTPETLRYYERLGLLRPHRSSLAGHRRYGRAEARRLRFIRRALDLGFTLSDVRELLALADGEHGGVARVRALAAARVTALEKRIAALVRLREALAGLVAECPGEGDPHACPILEALCAGGDETSTEGLA